LHVSQPTLSQQIKQLEDTLSAQLLDRSARTVQLTDAGAAYADYARRALKLLQAGKQAIHDVNDLSRGLLRLAVTPTFSAYLVGPLLEKYSSLFPNISVNVIEVSQDRMEAMLGNDDLDVGVAFRPTTVADIETIELFVERLALVVGKRHRHAGKTTPLTQRELNEESFVFLNERFATRHYIDEHCRQHNLSLRVVMQANSISLVVEIIRRSPQLATILPAAIAAGHEELCAIALEPQLPERHASLLVRKGGYRNAATSAFIELVLRDFAAASRAS
jgi:LysR family cyn operon transcriptional activator